MSNETPLIPLSSILKKLQDAENLWRNNCSSQDYGTCVSELVKFAAPHLDGDFMTQIARHFPWQFCLLSL